MRGNIEALRAALPKQAADEWFDPALAQHAAIEVHAQLQRWREQDLI
jgi:3-carboxy-cis,cis-muconate cycloisomerase